MTPIHIVIMSYSERALNALQSIGTQSAETVENAVGVVKQTTGVVKQATGVVENSAAAVNSLAKYIRNNIERRENAAAKNNSVSAIKTEEEHARLMSDLEKKKLKISTDIQEHANAAEKEMLEKKQNHNADTAAIKASQSQREAIAKIKAETEMNIQQLEAERKAAEALEVMTRQDQVFERRRNALYFNDVCRAFGFQKSHISGKYYSLEGYGPSWGSVNFLYPIRCNVMIDKNETLDVMIALKKKDSGKIPVPSLSFRVNDIEYYIYPGCQYYREESTPLLMTTNDVSSASYDASKPVVTVTFTKFAQQKFTKKINNINGGKGRRPRQKTHRKPRRNTKPNRKKSRRRSYI